jgi:hypothetical protein
VVSKSELVNSMAIETPTGFRTFNLYAGSINNSTDPLLVVSSWEIHGYPGGSVIDSITDSYKVRFDKLSPLINFGDGIGTFLVDPTPVEVPWELLVVGLPGAEGVRRPHPDDLLDQFKKGVWSLFGSLAALELRGQHFNSMSMPVLGGARDFCPNFVVSNLLTQSVDWLNSSKTMKTINAWVYEEKFIDTWIHAMDSALERQTISSASDTVAQALKDEIIVQLDISQTLATPPFFDATTGLSRELKHDEVSLQRLATFGRILVEQMAMQISIKAGLTWTGNLWEGITELGRRKIIAPWIVSHFHTLRVLGNELMHGHDEINYLPKDLQESDLVPVLACLSRLLSFWESWIKETQKEL